jgi:NAD-dependent dihydropyrimidine dehydrogenase PreA subunit
MVENLRRGRGRHVGIHHVSCYEGQGVMSCPVTVLTVNERIYEATQEAQNDCGSKCPTGRA